MNALDANLWPGVCNILLESTSFNNMVAPVRHSVFTHLWKTENHFLVLPWSVQSLDINIIENIWKIIKLNVQKELSAINSRQYYQVCSNDLKQSSLNLYSSALYINSAMKSFCYCAERIYNEILKRQASAFVEIMLFTMFEFNWQKNELSVCAAAIMTRFWPHAVCA